MNAKSFLYQTLGGIAFIGIFVVWAEMDPMHLKSVSLEDGPVENTTAILYGLACICFLVVAARSEFIRSRNQKLAYLMTFGWAAFCFMIMGEEISWGQRIFDINTPLDLAAMNVQEETNVHNLTILDDTLGGNYRIQSVLMLITGLVLPVIALTERGKRVFQYFAFPVAPLGYWLFFVGAYIYGKYYHTPIQAETSAAEVREIIFAVGVFAFALHGAIKPCILFRNCDTTTRKLPLEGERVP